MVHWVWLRHFIHMARLSPDTRQGRRIYFAIHADTSIHLTGERYIGQPPARSDVAVEVVRLPANRGGLY